VQTDKSSLTFTATQNKAPVEGTFKSYKADIRFDPEALEESHIRVEVDLASLSMAYEEAKESLLGKEWFATEKFPKAVFESKTIEAAGTNQYVAHGTLTLHGVSQPLDLLFTLREFGKTKAVADGKTILKRLGFGIGWEDTSTVADKVEVRFLIEAARANP
jgi:polyisoprenoid-binding protein YceI